MKKKVLVLSIIGVFIISIAISFAYWQIILKQESLNVANSDCFEIEFLSGEEITLQDAYPISDEEGMSLTPFQFRIMNKCDSYAKYQINIETLSHNNKVLPEKYLKVNLKEKEETKITSKLTSELEVEPTLENASKAFQLNHGVLKPKEEKEFTMHLWMHSDVLASDTDSMNATYNGKVSIISSYIKPSIMIMDELVPIITEGEGLYEVSHEDAEITYTDNIDAQEMLKQTEYRYAGSDPDNYVWFNNELWRIIGLVNTPEGARIKIIRDESIGAFSWDTSASSINAGYGVNEWSVADSKVLLNEGAYYNRTIGTCYNGKNNTTIPCDFSESGLLEESKSMIDTVTWNTGSNTVSLNYGNIKDFYHFERSDNMRKVCNGESGCNDGVERTTTWVGKIGLMYPSDYGYATIGGNTTDRSTCLNTELYSWSKNEECYQNNWMYNGSNYQWSLISEVKSDSAHNVFVVNYDGSVLGGAASYAGFILPSLYLKSNIRIVNGNGTRENPYELA